MVDLFGDQVMPEQHGSKLGGDWDYPPFSVLNGRDGWWQERKREWLSLGMKSEVGRENSLDGENLTFVRGDRDFSDLDETSQKILNAGNGTSIFDPVVCELAYRWFCPPGGQIIDPFAGGSVRGIVASHLGRKYVGVELRREQVEANMNQIHIAADPKPDWRNADSRDIARACFDVQADMIFSCPPYADLEVYSDDPADISTLPYDDFLESYRHIIKETCSLLRDNSFACFVVGDVRDKKGNYRNFTGDTVEAFRSAGLHFYNEAILVTAVGSVSLRAGKQFASSRKLGKTHQNVLVFVKGDGKKATQAMKA